MTPAANPGRNIVSVTHRHALVVLNRRAGAGGTDDLDDRIGAAFATHHMVSRILALDSALDIAEAVGRERSSGTVVVAAGGDGTVNVVARPLIGTTVPLGILPLGTMNHFAKDVGVPIDLSKAVAVIAAGRQTTVDVGDINGRPFLNNCSLGIYPSIVQIRDEIREQGYRKWVAFILAARRMIQRHHRALVRLQADGQVSVWRTPFVMVGNNAYDRTGLRFSGRSCLKRAELCAYLAPDIRARELPRLLIVKALRRLVGRPDSPSDPFHVVCACELWIEAKDNVPLSVAIDGEVVRSVPPLHLRSRPSALHVFAPAD